MPRDYLAQPRSSRDLLIDAALRLGFLAFGGLVGAAGLYVALATRPVNHSPYASIGIAFGLALLIASAIPLLAVIALMARRRRTHPRHDWSE